MSSNGEETPIAFQTFTVAVWGFGVAPNAFFLTLLWRYVAAWSLGKTLLFAFHGVALTHLLVATVPASISLATGRGLSAAQCAAVAPIIQVTTVLQPLSLCLSAILRWRMVRSTLRMDGKPPPRTGRYLVALVCLVLLVVVASAAMGPSSGVPAWWDTNQLVCLQLTGLFFATLIFTFLAPIPIMLYCYIRITTGFRSALKDNAPNQNVKNMVRLFIVLSVLYYCTQLPFTIVVALLSNGIKVSHIFARFVTLLQTTYLVTTPILSILLTPKYLKIARRILAGLSAVVTSTKTAATTTQNKSSVSNTTSVAPTEA